MPFETLLMEVYLRQILKKSKIKKFKIFEICPKWFEYDFDYKFFFY